jgi:hypothetical protein
VQVLEPHTLHAGTHEGKASFLIIYIYQFIYKERVLFFGSTKDDHLVVNMVVNLL